MSLAFEYLEQVNCTLSAVSRESDSIEKAAGKIADAFIAGNTRKIQKHPCSEQPSSEQPHSKFMTPSEMRQKI